MITTLDKLPKEYKLSEVKPTSLPEKRAIILRLRDGGNAGRYGRHIPTIARLRNGCLHFLQLLMEMIIMELPLVLSTMKMNGFISR